MSGQCRGRCEHCQHTNRDAQTEAEDHAGRLCDLVRTEMSERDMAVLDDCCEVRQVGLTRLTAAPKVASAPAPRVPAAKTRPPVPPEPATRRPPVRTPPVRTPPAPAAPPAPPAPPVPRTPPEGPPRRSRSPARSARDDQTKALMDRVSELTTLVTQLVAERDEERQRASSSHRRRARSDSRDSRRRGRSRYEADRYESRYTTRYEPRYTEHDEDYGRRASSARPPRRSPSPLPRRRPQQRPMSVESVLAGWPSHLDLPAKDDDGSTSWNQRVEAHQLSVELLDAMWYAAAVDDPSNNMAYKQKCLRWIGPYFPGSGAQERKVQVVEENNIAANVKVVLGVEYIGICLREPHDGKVKRSWASPRMRSLGWSVTIYDYIDRSWTVDGTYPCEQKIEYNSDATGRIFVYHPAREESVPDEAPPEENGPGDDGGDDGGGGGPGDDVWR
eukprot:s374_g35.t1